MHEGEKRRDVIGGEHLARDCPLGLPAAHLVGHRGYLPEFRAKPVVDARIAEDGGGDRLSARVADSGGFQGGELFPLDGFGLLPPEAARFGGGLLDKFDIASFGVLDQRSTLFVVTASTPGEGEEFLRFGVIEPSRVQLRPGKLRVSEGGDEVERLDMDSALTCLHAPVKRRVQACFLGLLSSVEFSLCGSAILGSSV